MELEKFVINGGNRLFGKVSISGAKNAAVAILPAAVLAGDVVTIENVPKISDIGIIVQILEKMGAKVEYNNGDKIVIDSTNIRNETVPTKLASKFRASYYFLGIMLGRFNEAEVAMPGGDNFGVRPIDQHIKGFEALGASVTLPEDNVCGTVKAKAHKLIGSSIYMDVVSVGATINVMLAAVLANGVTEIVNAAKEPHIVDLANFLNRMGADVRGAGTDVIKIHGVEKMHGCTYSIIPDQIQAGTYMVAAAACGGEVIIEGVIPKHLESIGAKLEEAGATVEVVKDDAICVARFKPLVGCNVKTMPHPGFPTDMHPQIAAMLSVAKGKSVINESVWENRFQYVDELVKMGANIDIQGRLAHIEGKKRLTGADVVAPDLRAGAAMIIAGLVADGETTISNIHWIDRGYEGIVEKLTELHADIKRVEFED